MESVVSDSIGGTHKSVLNIHWAIWSILIAAALSFVAALTTGSFIDLLVCLACLVGLVGIAPMVD